MKFTDNFSSNTDKHTIFIQKPVPVFQNKTYNKQEDAFKAEMGKVELVQSEVSGFVYNRLFEPDLMVYDINYQNEQSNSLVFKNHLQSVLKYLLDCGISSKKVVEIGCGKGVFFDMMLKENVDCWGFDPTYEGDNPRVIKNYFSDQYNDINAEVVIMRHTLEHISEPFSFIHTIAQANNYKGYLFVEVPTFDWIVNKNAYWDIFFEHCNYFTEKSLACMFDDSKTGNFFGGQYIYLWADLGKLKTRIDKYSFCRFDNLMFSEKIKEHELLLQTKGPIVVWGAGGKGSTFLNLHDKKRERVSYVVDVNPLKQNRFIAGTGHPISPAERVKKDRPDLIIIMNENYKEEIEKMVNNPGIKIVCIDKHKI